MEFTNDTSNLTPATKEWVSRLYAAVDGMNQANFKSFLDDESVLYFGNHPKSTGAEVISQGIDNFWKSIGGLHHKFHRVWENGDTVILDALIDYTRHDGKVVEIPCVTIVSREEETVRDMRIYLDVAPIYDTKMCF